MTFGLLFFAGLALVIAGHVLAERRRVGLIPALAVWAAGCCMLIVWATSAPVRG